MSGKISLISAPTDFSPVGAMTSPAIAFMYTGILIYSCFCIAIGFKIAHSRWKDRDIMCMSPRVTFILAGVSFTLFFLVFIIPILIACVIYTAVYKPVPTNSQRPLGIIGASPQSRSRLRYLNLWDLGFNLSSSSASRNTSRRTTRISSDRSSLPRYGQHHRDTRIDPMTVDAQPETPPPAYLPPDRV
ncbi:hypothetical protein F4814DRAFT_445089 [Daldinia grandis]|nr:hypothetical protein F4814DRAFT_445089 [Daldinia grandis]